MQVKSSLLLRLATVIALAFLIMGYVVAEVFYRYTHAAELKNGYEMLAQLHLTVSTTASIAAYLNDADLANEVVSGLVKNDIVLAAKIDSLTDTLATSQDFSDQNSFSFPLYSPFASETTMGTLLLLPNVAYIEGRAKDIGQKNYYVLLVLAVAVTLLSIIICYFIITRPMVAIAEKLHSLAPGTDARLAKPRTHAHSELGLVVDDINHLLQKTENLILEEHRLREQIGLLEKRKSDFLASMSHEIRTPINGVLGMVELLQDTELTPQQQRQLGIIQQSGSALLAVINDILDFSKIEAGKLDLDIIPSEIEQVIEGSIAPLIQKAAKVGVPLIVVIDPDVPNCVLCDPLRIRQILLNFLSNAYKFTERGEVVLAVSLSESDTDPPIPQLVFSVTDSGIGLSDEQQQTLFSAYSQADASVSRQYGGTGLGLAICKALVELMQGDIGVESQLGQGSCFWYAIPLQTVDDATAKHLLPYEGKRALVFAQHPLVQQSVCQALRKLGIRTFVTDLVDQVLEWSNETSQDDPIELAFVDCSTSMGEQERTRFREAWVKNSHAPRPLIWMTDIGVEPGVAMGHGDLCLEHPVLPMHIRHAVEHAVARKTGHTGQSDPATRQSFAELRVLVAEDNPVNQLVITGHLRKLDVEPVVCANGEEVVHQFTANPGAFDVILMDCEMPVMDGFEATRRIREMPLTPHHHRITIIALTAHVLPEYEARARECGMDGFLRKPVARSELVATLQGLLSDLA